MTLEDYKKLDKQSKEHVFDLYINYLNRHNNNYYPNSPCKPLGFYSYLETVKWCSKCEQWNDDYFMLDGVCESCRM